MRLNQNCDIGGWSGKIMNQCKYLMILNSRFCRLKGQENPRCKQCSVKDSNKAKNTDRTAARWLRRLRPPV